MSDHLLAISVGPVQEFIAAARRTRDLWFGSYLLSEISRAVALSVEQQGGKLIFPAAANARNVANVILAELESGDPKLVAANARKAAMKRWREFAASAEQEIQINTSQVVRQDVWANQVDDVIEFFAAWVPRNGEYHSDRANGMRLLAGRKNCRDFMPAKGRAGLPKSSLDGQRETVLHPQSQWQRRFRAKLRVRDGEQLDVIGLVKRVAEGNQPYPSVSRVAADPWVRGNLQKLQRVIAACEALEQQQILRRLDVQAFPKFATFRYEGTAVFTSRHHELLEETLEPDERRTVEQRNELLKNLRNALAELPEPNPYLAVMVADGDKIGAAISQLCNPQINRDFSNALAGFADAARNVVEEHHGVLVYAGGDDVLAFLPVDKCLECARKLHDDFGERMSRFGQPTLSVGIAIGHFMENLEDLLDYGRAAEKAAKEPDRDGLAVHLHKRGGAPIRVRSTWSENPDQKLTQNAELIRVEAIPGKLPYDLRNLAKLYDDWPAESLTQALRKDVLRVIRDKQPRGGRAYMEEIEQLVDERLSDAASLDRFSRELLVARQLAEAIQQANTPIRTPIQPAAEAIA